jgi:hypothetical protein
MKVLTMPSGSGVTHSIKSSAGVQTVVTHCGIYEWLSFAKFVKNRHGKPTCKNCLRSQAFRRFVVQRGL